MTDLNLKTQDMKFIFNPTNYLFGIVDDAKMTELVIESLVLAGFSSNRITVFQGERGVRQIDATGAEHGRIARLIRWRQSTTPARWHAERYEQAVRDGHCVVAVYTSDQDSRERARQIMKQNGGHFINFYGRLVIYTLDS